MPGDKTNSPLSYQTIPICVDPEDLPPPRVCPSCARQECPALYVKLQANAVTEFTVISFKEK
jgi:hypothetical protein